MQRQSPRNKKDILMAIFIGACVSFLTTLFDGLADFLRTNGDTITASLSSMGYYLAKNYHV